MPHAIIEYSDNLNPAVQDQQLLALVHQTLIESGLLAPENLKTRLWPVAQFKVGLMNAADQPSFMHVKIYLLEGRTMQQKQDLSDVLLAAISKTMPQISQLTVDIREMVKETYRKYLNHSAA